MEKIRQQKKEQVASLTVPKAEAPASERHNPLSPLAISLPSS